jgi:restriction system protein
MWKAGAMSTMWGIHNDKPEFDFVQDGFIAVGWSKIETDLREIGDDKEQMKAAVAEAYPDAKPGAIPVWAGVLMRFAFRMRPGDIVVHPSKADSTLNFGRIEGGYYWKPSASDNRHRRKVTWLETGVPRAGFSKTALYEVGSAVTLFRVKTHDGEFLDFLRSGADAPPPRSAGAAPEEAADTAEDEPNAERIETYARDFVIDTLHTEIDGVRFEHFVAHLLRVMGYRATVTQASGDGGFDIVAHRDPLGLEPPIVKVQCKRIIDGVGAPEVQKLVGTLAPGGRELGLFVTLGGYSREALQLERTRQELRLISGPQLVDMVFEHYEDFAPEWKRLLPMRRVHVVDRGPEDAS